jgi:hypothetical protein
VVKNQTNTDNVIVTTEKKCLDYQNRIFAYYECGKLHIVYGPFIGIIAGGVLVILIIILCFTHCLKKRLIDGKPTYLCRRSTMKLYCLYRRPRSFEESIKKSTNKKQKHYALPLDSPHRDASGVVPVVVQQPRRFTEFAISPVPLNAPRGAA